MRPLLLALILLVGGCGLSYEISWPFDLSLPTYAVRGEPIPRTLYVGACEYYFGQRLTDTAQSCIAALQPDSSGVWSVSDLEFFGDAQAWLFGNSADELNRIIVGPDVPEQFDGIVDYYASLFELEPLLTEDPLSGCEAAYVGDPGPVRRIADWKDTVTHLIVSEDGCTGLVTLQFTDIYAHP